MLQTIRTILAKRQDEEEGFTLIELMVVVLIIAILIAIAIPTFLGAKNTANDRAVQANLRNALTNADSIYADTQDYSVITAASLTAVEPAITFASGSVTSATNQVGVQSGSVSGGTYITFAALSKAGNCWIEYQPSNGKTTFDVQKSSSTTACTTLLGTDSTTPPTNTTFPST
ncbi:MAG: prepilin-type N-terminal cleavage/methylation domain-containing protein [Acidimicrobiales bacterium]